MEDPNANPASDAPRLTVDTSVAQRQPSEEELTSPNFTTSPTSAALEPYPPPQQMQQVLDNEKIQVDDEAKPAPVFSAIAPKLSIVRRNTTSYQKQTFRMEAGINPAATIAERLQAWRGILKNLAIFWKEISAAHSQTAKGYTKGASVIEIPFQSSGLHFREDGGVQTVWAATREYAVHQAKHHNDYSLFLDRAIIQGLRAVKKEVKVMIHSINSDDRLKTERLYRYREQADILQTRLNKYIQLVHQSPEHAMDKTDPYIVNSCLLEQMIKLYKEENRLHASMINLQGEYAIFERKIIENARSVMLSLQEYKTQDKYLTDQTVKSIMDTFNNLDADCEYKVFFERRQGELVPDNAAYRNLNDIHYENQNHPLVMPCKVGFIERKTFVTKNWVEHKYALTPTGYLHEYRSEKDFPCNPEKSIFIPHTTVIGREDNMHHDYIFEIRGRNNSKGKLMKTLDRDKNYILRTRTGGDMQAWMDLLTPMSHQFRPSVPHEPEPYQQPINSTNVEVMSRSNTWASSPLDQHGDTLSRADTWASVPEDQLRIEDSHAANRSSSEQAAAGISNMDINGQQANVVPQNAGTNDMVGQSPTSMQPGTQQFDQMDHGEKTQADEHNPFVPHQQESNSMAQNNAEPGADYKGKASVAQGKLPVSLFDQDETPKTEVQRNQTMPGTLMF
ncbi:hypothetical protein K450DRAFT_245321 [Umbelopsis ramanniana AG]|uniref:PH domain-containing protein n=1 Tax=Umbelopsis ramanniana AG TaxID=1314678 RepID=A0AAD5E8A5_UMBRA|nr:uncharacterized protein K450DRAFT_245321 [Umbelopsis ramanniana AG]KAI8578752.1 hypothetical protein K450DRAFT_245321 [Umbelopsis ramanniana AG]